MDPDYQIVRYQPDLKRQVIELQTHLWSPDLDLNASYFHWKYERNPYVKKPLIYLATSNDKVVGMRGFFGVQWECGTPAQVFTALYADDMVIAPEHRNRGLMSKIMTSAFEDLADEDYDYAFNLSAGWPTLSSSLSMSWRSAGWVRPMRWRSWPTTLRRGVLRRLKGLPIISDRLARLASRQFLKSRNTLQTADLRRANYLAERTPAISVEDSPRCAAMAELVGRIGGSGQIRHVRDGKYFEWRFQNPLSCYRYIYWGNDRLEGYLVLQEYTSKYADRNVLNIVDWEASDATIQEHLLEAAASVFAKGRELTIWSATLPGPTIAMLREKGFRFLPRPSQLNHFPPEVLVRSIVNPGSGGDWVLWGRSLLELANWDLRMLYSMHG